MPLLDFRTQSIKVTPFKHNHSERDVDNSSFPDLHELQPFTLDTHKKALGCQSRINTGVEL